MTPKIKLDLSEVRCAKPGCKRSYKGKIHRHHIRHKKWWINRAEHGDLKFTDDALYFIRRLKERYYQWNERDLIRLCEYHHVEIHAIYQRLNRTYILSKPYGYKFTRRDIVKCLRACKQACFVWLGKKSRGMNPRVAGWRRRKR